MMMHYPGLGVGHMNPAGFPSEANTISVIPEPHYVPAQTKIFNGSGDIASSTLERSGRPQQGGGKCVIVVV